MPNNHSRAERCNVGNGRRIPVWWIPNHVLLHCKKADRLQGPRETAVPNVWNQNLDGLVSGMRQSKTSSVSTLANKKSEMIDKAMKFSNDQTVNLINMR